MCGRVKTLLRIPDRVELITVLPFGYRAEKTVTRGRKRRKPLSEIAHGDRFGQRLDGASG